MEVTFPLGLISLTKVYLCEYSQLEKGWAIKPFYFSLKDWSLERPLWYIMKRYIFILTTYMQGQWEYAEQEWVTVWYNWNENCKGTQEQNSNSK